MQNYENNVLLLTIFKNQSSNDENQYKTNLHHHSNFMTLEPYDEQYQFQISI